MSLSAKIRRWLAAKGKDSLSQTILRGGFTSMAVRVAGLVLGFISHVLISRLLGVADYGVYSVIIGWTLIMVVPVKFGLDISVLRFASVYYDARDFRSFRELAAFCAKFVFGATLFFGAGVVAVVNSFPNIIGTSDFATTILMIVLVGALAFIGIFQSFFRALHEIFLSQWFEQVLRSTLLIVLIGIFWLCGQDSTLESAILATTLAAVISSIALFIRFRSALVARGMTSRDPELNSSAVRDGPRRWLQVSWPILVAVLAGSAMAQGGTILTSILAGSTDAGIYSAAARLSSFAAFALTALNAISAPMVASSFARKAFSELAHISLINARLSFMGSLFISSLLFFCGKPLLGLFGSEFVDGYSVLMILLFAGLIHAALGQTAALLAMTDMHKAAMIQSIVALCVVILAGVILVPQLGAIGSAIAYSLGMVYQKVVAAALVYRRFGIDSSVLGLHNKAMLEKDRG